MERYFIALYKLGINNELLIKTITDYDFDLIIRLFEGNTDILLTKIEWLQYREIFEDHLKVSAALEAADNILRINMQNDICTALYSTVNYPQNLMRMVNPPAIIYYKGANPNEGFEKAIASIGTRKPTPVSYTHLAALQHKP